MRSNAPPETNASRDIPPRAPRLCVHQTGSRGGAEIGSAAATSGHGMPHRGSDVGARHAASRQRRRGTAYRVAAATSGHGMPCPDPDTSPPRSDPLSPVRHQLFHHQQRRRGAACRVAAATSGHSMPRRGSDVGARHAASRQRRRGTACRVAAATSGHGIPRRGSDVGARHAVPRP